MNLEKIDGRAAKALLYNVLCVLFQSAYQDQRTLWAKFDIKGRGAAKLQEKAEAMLHEGLPVQVVVDGETTATTFMGKVMVVVCPETAAVGVLSDDLQVEWTCHPDSAPAREALAVCSEWAGPLLKVNGTGEQYHADINGEHVTFVNTGVVTPAVQEEHVSPEGHKTIRMSGGKQIWRRVDDGSTLEGVPSLWYKAAPVPKEVPQEEAIGVAPFVWRTRTQEVGGCTVVTGLGRVTNDAIAGEHWGEVDLAALEVIPVGVKYPQGEAVRGETSTGIGTCGHRLSAQLVVADLEILEGQVYVGPDGRIATPAEVGAVAGRRIFLVSHLATELLMSKLDPQAATSADMHAIAEEVGSNPDRAYVDHTVRHILATCGLSLEVRVALAVKHVNQVYGRSCSERMLAMALCGVASWSDLSDPGAVKAAIAAHVASGTFVEVLIGGETGSYQAGDLKTVTAVEWRWTLADDRVPLEPASSPAEDVSVEDFDAFDFGQPDAGTAVEVDATPGTVVAAGPTFNCATCLDIGTYTDYLTEEVITCECGAAVPTLAAPAVVTVEAPSIVAELTEFVARWSSELGSGDNEELTKLRAQCASQLTIIEAMAAVTKGHEEELKAAEEASEADSARINELEGAIEELEIEMHDLKTAQDEADTWPSGMTGSAANCGRGMTPHLATGLAVLVELAERRQTGEQLVTTSGRGLEDIQKSADAKAWVEAVAAKVL